MYFRSNGRDERTRYEYNYLTIKQYLKRKCDNYDISKVFSENNYKTIAIYGAGEIAKCLCKDLMDSEIKVNCFIELRIEKYPDRSLMGYPVLSIPEIKKKCKADVIVVTPIYEFNNIADTLIAEGWSLDRIMSLSEVVF